MIKNKSDLNDEFLKNFPIREFRKNTFSVLKKLSQKMNINFNDVINASKTKPFGFMPFYPGPGIGGHCIPIDPLYLSWKAKQLNFDTKFIKLSGEINAFVINYIFKNCDIISLHISSEMLVQSRQRHPLCWKLLL